MNNLVLAQTVSLNSCFYLGLANVCGILKPPASQNSTPVKFALRLLANLVCAPKQGTDPEAVMHLGRIYPVDCQPESGPGWWWFKLKLTLVQSKLLVLICSKNLFVMCSREMQLKKITCKELLFNSQIALRSLGWDFKNAILQEKNIKWENITKMILE